MHKASHNYVVYGLTVSSEIPLSLPIAGDGSLAVVTITTGGPEHFEREVGAARHEIDWDSWFHYVPLPDGRSYVRGWNMGEFLVAADGRHIVVACEPGASDEAFQVYMLGQALSFALLKLGFEPLHATAVVIDGGAVALLGESGSGKSTLAAAFVDAGFPLLTDDVLMVQERDGRVMAYPGPQRLKLFPKAAAYIGTDVTRAVRMNLQTAKMVIPLDARQSCNQPVPIAAMYEVAAPRGAPGFQAIRIDRMTGRDAALALVRAAFNQRLVTRARLNRQFSASVALAEQVPVKRLSYPRLLSHLPTVVSTIIADALQKDSVEASCAG